MLLIKGDKSGEFIQFPNIEKHYQIHSFYKKIFNNEQKLKNIEQVVFTGIQDLNLPFTQEDIKFHFDMIKYDKLFENKHKKKKFTLFDNVKDKIQRSERSSSSARQLMDQNKLALIYCICQTKTIRNKKLIFDLLKLDKILELKLYSYDSDSFIEKLPVLQKTIIRHEHIFNKNCEWLFDYLNIFNKQRRRFINPIFNISAAIVIFFI